MHIDHVVLWVEDPLRSLEFFEHVVGLVPLRVAEFRAGQAPFPSVRVSTDTIIDLMPHAMAARVDKLMHVAGTAGHVTNHVCLAMPHEEFEALAHRLEANQTPPLAWASQHFGARGHAPRAFYFRDPDGNMFEARYYSEVAS